jgi:hypothetical protein
VNYAAEIPEFPVIGSLIFGALWVGILLAVYAVLFHIGPAVAAALKVIRTAPKLAEAPEEFDTQPRTSERDSWDCDVADAILLTHEAVDLDDAMHGVDFTEFEDEFAKHRKVQRLAARLEERQR